MKIAVIGASGWLGGEVAREAIRRGHEVTAIARDGSRLAGLGAAHEVSADIEDLAVITGALAGHDVVVSAITDRSTTDRSVIPASARMLLVALPAAGVSRLAFVGGGGSLEIAPGNRAVDQPGFPAEYRAEALAQADALAVLRSDGGALEWTYLSPPPHHLEAGASTGTYRVQGGDGALFDADGDSRITAGDFASAMVDELERPRFVRERFTAAY
jgi:putative NADH-flavin reductase